ncbi:hypothetical protein LIER_23067 [Lithospermum erythrorhizon]|uniref:Uncharacterized protein n=1 Tax=Lithospermum erythrorhizon TaxID=34254 RepID=A0AAV3QW21_LITER
MDTSTAMTLPDRSSEPLQKPSLMKVHEQRSFVSQLNLEKADNSQQIHTLGEEIQVEQAKRQGLFLADLEAARLGLVGLL